MKQYLLSVSPLMTGPAMAQVNCLPEPCTSYQVYDSTASRYFDGNRCLRGSFYVPTSVDSATFINFSLLSLNHLRIESPLIIDDGDTLVTNHCILDNTVSSGNNRIYILDSGLVSVNISFSGPGETTIYLREGDRVWINGQYYYPGQTVFVGPGKIPVVKCGQILALRPAQPSPFVPNITYRFIVTGLYGGAPLRKTCTYKQLWDALPYSYLPYYIEAGGKRDKVTKLPQ